MLHYVTAVEITSPNIHETAAVEPGASIGSGTIIWHHSQIRRDAVIGSDCTIGKNVFVDERVRIGDRVKIQNNVSVYRGVEVEDEVFIGPSVVFTNDLRPRAVSQDWQLATTQVRHGASVGANATIVCGVEVGARGMVGAGAVVTRSVRPHQLVAGNPAIHRGWVCACGTVVSRADEPPAHLLCERCATADGLGVEPDADESRPAEPQVRLASVQLGREEEGAVLAVLRSGHLAGGPRARELEESFARVHEIRHAVAVSNGTLALVAALRANGIGPGDEVITSPLTFVATLSSILEVGATARFADVGEDLNLDPAAVVALITPRTRALMPVHLYGLPGPMAEIADLARRHGLAIIEDAAQAHGARVAGRTAGSFGTGTFSFYATKNITCGEGGVVTTNDDEVATRLRLLRNHGMRARYDYAMPGSNYRLTDLQAAIALEQLRKLPVFAEARSLNAARLSAGLAGLDGLVLPWTPVGRRHAWHQYTVRVGPGAAMDREQLGKFLTAAGVESMAYYPRLVHDYPCFRDHPQVSVDSTPRAHQAASEVLSLPVHPGLSDRDLDRIVSCVRAALAQ
jgi:dTDP-4-amino-4,6-dideoxygalactose transaminase/acetyltransferase-like isoleucine patch superfamily enzyme